MSTIDKTDLAILGAIKHNARLSVRQISKKTGVPIATVNRRMNHMVENGVIRGFNTDIDYEQLGKNTVAYVLIRSSPQADQNDIIEEARKHEAVEDFAAITGPYDFLLKIRVGNTDEMSKFLFEDIRKFPSVAQTETLLALNLKPYLKSRKKG